jgi:dipeptidyl aminopeptidase/acylaminoacyl peptidase
MNRILPLVALLAFPLACEPPAPPASVPAPPPAAAPPPVVASPTPALRAPAAPLPIEAYFAIRRVGGTSFSFDEKLIAFSSDEGGRPDVWVRPIAGGAATQITHVKGWVHSFAFSPKRDQLVYEADADGNEVPHLFLTNARGESPRELLADCPAGRRSSFIRWGDDGNTLLYTSNARDPHFMDLYEYDVGRGKAALLWQASERRSLALVSRDHRRFIVQEELASADTNLLLVARGGKGAPVLLTPHAGKASHEARGITKDGRTLYYTSDEGREHAALFAVDLGTEKTQEVLEADWDVEGAGLSRDDALLWTNTNVAGAPRFVVTDRRSKREIALPAPPPRGAWAPNPGGQSVQEATFSPSGRYLALELRTDENPWRSFLVDLRAGTFSRVTDLPETPPGTEVPPSELVRVRSFDGREVPAFVRRPRGEGPFPAVIDVHGGPTYEARHGYDRMHGYLVSKGYVVMEPNVRGSTGYGKSYTALDDKDFGGGPLRDVVACKQWLVANARVDPDKVVVLGASYGGYMALAAATFTPTEFAAIVDYYGISDLKSLVQSFPLYWRSQAEIHAKFGDPDDPADAAYLHDRSPIYFVDRIVRPLLVVQGTEDVRVRKDQSDRMVAALRERHAPVHYLVLPGEGHGFSKTESYLAACKTTDRFLDRYIFGDTSVEVLPPDAAGSPVPSKPR